MKAPHRWLVSSIRSVCVFAITFLFSAGSAQAGTHTVPSPPAGRQAKVQTAFDSSDGSIYGTRLYISDPPIYDGRFTFITDGGAGYGPSHDVTIVSAAGSGASGFATITRFGNIDELFIRGGSGYSDDVTVVIWPPRTNAFQAYLDNTSCDTIQLGDGTYFQNAVITRDLTIKGRGRGRTLISGGLLGSVIRVLPGKTLRLEDLTLFDGLAPNGGGVYNDGGVVYIDRCEIHHCRAYGTGGEGGGIYNRGSAILTVTDSRVHHNIATRDGGGISSSGINTSVLPALAGSLETPANSLKRFFTGLSDFRPPASGASLEDQFDAAVSQLNDLMDGFQGFGSATNVFASLGSDPFAPGADWNGFGLPVTRIINSTISDNQVGKGIGTATPTELDCVNIAGDVFCDYYPGTHDIRFLGWGAGIHNDLGLLILDKTAVTRNTTRTDLGSFGGGVSTFFGAVKATQSKLNDNVANSATILASGAALHAFASVTQIEDSELNGNDTEALFLSSGGAVKNTALSFLDLSRSQANGNTSGGGGALANDYLALANISASSLSSNAVTGVVGAYGGGVRNEVGGHVLLSDSTLSGNSAKGKAKGGGLYNQCETNRVVRLSTAKLVNCTVSGNKVDGVGTFGIPLEALGAGLYNGSANDGKANLLVTSCTIVSNTASGGLLHIGGGFYNTALSTIKLKVTDSARGTSLIEIGNNLIAGNAPEDCFNNFATLSAFTVSLGYNLDTDGTGSLAAAPSDLLLGSASFLTVEDPLISPLQFNGGRTLTHALLPGSPAIDRGSTPGTPAEAVSANTDQRGVARSLGGRRDIGAVETVPPTGAPDAFQTLEDLALVVNAPGVLANDVATAATAEQTSSPANGTLELRPDGSFIYTPTANFLGTDSFTYRVVGASGAASPDLNVRIDVQPRLDLISLVPAAGSKVQRFENVVLTFDEPVTAEAIIRNVTLAGSQSGPHGYTVNVSGNVVTLDPEIDFQRGELVAVTVESELTSAAGSPLWPAPPVHIFSIFPNRAPVPDGDALSVVEDGVLDLALPASFLSNDTDPDNDPVLAANLVHRGNLGALWLRFGFGITTTYEGGEWPNGYYVYRQPVPVTNAVTAHGHIDLRADGTLTYRPDANFAGTDTFEYDVTDGSLRSPFTTVTINVTAVNDAPVARTDNYASFERSISAARGVLVNDSDAEGSPLTAVLTTPPAHGSVTLNLDGSFTYAPGAGFAGVDSFTYQASDGQASSGPARAKIGNTPPNAIADAYAPTFGQPFSANALNGVLPNDSDPDGDQPLTARLATGPSHGTLSLNTDGSFTYTPNSGYLGADVFTYTANDGLANSAPIRVKLGNTAPVASDDPSYIAFAGQPLTTSAAQGVLSNDADPDGDPVLTAVLASNPMHGAVTFSADGSFTYTPQAGFVGDDTFTYAARDGSLNSSAATVTIHVNEVLRIVSRFPGRNAHDAETNSEIVITFSVPLNAASVSGRFAVHGSQSGAHAFSDSVDGASVTLRCAADFLPGETVHVTALSGIQGTGFSQLDGGVTWQFQVRAARGGTRFTAGAAPSATPRAGRSVAIGDLNGDGYPDAFVRNGDGFPTVLLNNRDRTFTERVESLGLTSFFGLPGQALLADFDGDGRLDVVSDDCTDVRVGLNNGTGQFPTVRALPTAPHCVGFWAAGDFDGDGDLDLFGAGFDGAWLYRNGGAANFTFDNELAFDSHILSGTVGDVDNDGDLDVYLTGFDGDVLLLNDGKGHFTRSTTPLNTAYADAVALADFNGDANLDALIAVRAYPLSSQLWFGDGAGHFTRSTDQLPVTQSFSLGVADFDSDGDLDAWQGNHGGDTLEFNSGLGRFTQSATTFGTNITYAIGVADFDRDGDLDVIGANIGSNGGIVGPALNEIWFNETAPVTRDDFYTPNGSNPLTVSAALGVLANDTAGDGGPISAVLDLVPAHGSVSLNADGSFTYTPGVGFIGTDAFTYHAQDSIQSSRVAHVKIGNTAPLASNDGPFVAVNDGPFRLSAPGVLANDTDADNDPLHAILVTAPAHGSLAVGADGAVFYTPVVDYIGADNFTYHASDGVTTSGLATVTFEVRARLAVTAWEPPSNVTHASADQNIIVRFNHALNPASVSGHVFLRGSETGPRPFTSSVLGDTLTLDPATPFRFGEEVTVTLAVGLEGISGEQLGGGVTESFRVEAPTGGGLFTDSGQRLGDTDYSSTVVVLGDLDGDGDLDAFIVNTSRFINGTSFPGSVRVWFNNGSGQFTDSGQILTGTTISAALGDVDGDGDLDAVVVMTEGIKVCLNNGAGAFTITAQTLGTTGRRSFLADLDNDGDLDVLNMGNFTFSVWFNDGAGQFTENTASVANLSFVNRAFRIGALGDVDGDGSLDFVVRQPSFSGNSIVVFLNDGHGVFTDSGLDFGRGGNVLALGDLNGDGALDVFAPSANGPYLWLNNGAGVFIDSGLVYGNLNATEAQLADVNGDGTLDAIVLQDETPAGGKTLDRSTSYLNDGLGNFIDSGHGFGVFRQDSNGNAIVPAFGAFAVGDMDNSGSPDLFLPIGFAQPNQVWLNHSVLAPLNGFASAVVDDSMTVAPFAQVVIHAPAAASVTLSVMLDDAAKGGFTADSLAASGFGGPVGNSYSLSATTASSAQAALRQLIFAPTPNHVSAGASEVTTFTVIASDGIISRTNSTTTVTAISVNDAPAAANDGGSGFTTTDAASFTTGSVLANDFDPDISESLTVQSIDTTGALGLVTSLGNGAFRYDPNGQFIMLPAGGTATDSFVYTIRDATGLSSSAIVRITVNGVNQPPAARDDAIAVNEGSGPAAISQLLLSNDSDPDTGDQAAFLITAIDTTGTRGLVQLVDGDLRYNPSGLPNLAPGALATDSFRYTLSDGHGGAASAVVNVTITGVNDAPVLGSDLLTVSADAPIMNITPLLLANDSDADPGETDGLRLVSLDTTATRGLALLSTNALAYYQPTNFAYLKAGQTATDTFGYIVEDVHGARSTGRVEVTVNGVNDAPVPEPDHVVFDAGAPSRDLTAEIKANDTDPDDPPSALVITAATPGPNPKGALQFANGAVSYQPSSALRLTSQQVVTDMFTYTLSDALGATRDATVTVHIVGKNTAPVANAASFTVNEDQSLSGTITATDADGNTMSYAIGTSTVNGTLTFNLAGQFTYAPNANFNGSDSFTFKANDGIEDSAPATVTLVVNPVNDPPSFVKSANVTIAEDSGGKSIAGWATAISAGPPNEADQTLAFMLTNNNPSLFSTQPALAADGTLAFTPASNASGSANVTAVLKDSGGSTHGGQDASASQSFTITVTPVNDAPTLTTKSASQTVQYSDPISVVQITASDNDSPASSLVVATSWQKDGGAFVSGLPGTLKLAQVSTAANSRVWTLSGIVTVAPGIYVVRATVTDDENATGTIDLTISVTEEDARVAYTGAMFASTSSTASDTATVMLSATIQDITAVATEGASDSSAGDIRNAKVTFINRDTGAIIASDLPVSLVNSSDSKTGTATFNWNVNIGLQDSQSYSIGVIVKNFYTRDDSTDNTILTVSKPVASDFATGGGYLILSRSAGLYLGNPGSKANFGFNVKYNKTSKTLQGDFELIFQSGARVFSVQGNAITSLSISGNRATFNAKASIIDLTDPLLPVSVDDNATLQVKLTDNGEPGKTDTIALTVWNKKGGLSFASNWDGTKTVEQMLEGGNLVVRSGTGTALAALRRPESFVDTKPIRLSITVLADREADVAQPSRYQIRFPAEPDADYTLEYSTDLLSWSYLATVTSYDPEVVFFDEPLSSEGHRFYRARQLINGR